MIPVKCIGVVAYKYILCKYILLTINTNKSITVFNLFMFLSVHAVNLSSFSSYDLNCLAYILCFYLGNGFYFQMYFR